MRKVFKWLGIIVLSIVVILVVASMIMINKYHKMAKVTYTADVPNIAILKDSASLARGAVIAASACTGCHGGDFAGKKFFDDPKLGVVPAPNITRGGRTKNYSDLDYIRTIKYGVKPDGHGLFVMPVEDFNLLSDIDLGSLIGYIQSVPASDKTWPDPHFTTLAEIMAGAGLFGTMYNAELLDLNNNKPVTAPPYGTSVEYGYYTMKIHGCWTCHGEQLNGHKTPDPVSPPAANITPNGHIGKWTLDQFKETLHTGNTPEGKKLDPKYMPWDALGLMDDVEFEALYNYLKTVPPLDDAPDLVKYNEKHKK